MKKLCFIFALLCISTFIYGCDYQQKSYNIPSDFTKMPFYQGDKGKYLGKNEGNQLSNVYELKEMSSSDYLYISESFVVGNPKSDQYILMKKILRNQYYTIISIKWKFFSQTAR